MGMTRKFSTASRLSLRLGIALSMGACSGGGEGGAVYVVTRSPSAAASSAPSRDSGALPASKASDDTTEPAAVNRTTASAPETNDEPRPVR